MTFADIDPPCENQKDEYPTFDNVVTVSNCFYYLSLLERFVETTKNMSENLLKLYLVRAEYRYFKWAYSLDTDFGSIKNAIPPLDIAFFWQAHMLSPLRFFEDSIRNSQLCHYRNIKMPLKEIHGIKTGVPVNVLTAWKNVMKDEPYHLTEEYLSSENISTRYAEISCIVCFVKMEIEWENYTQWRTDHTTALQCHRCRCMFTIKHIGKANLIADLSKTRAIAGLMLKNEGKRALVNSKDIGALGPNRKIKALPFNEGLKPLEDLIDLHQAAKWEKDADNLHRRINIIDAIHSTYFCNPYKGSSIDLIQAVARQYKFAFKATQNIDWDLPQGIIKGIRQYSNFLHLIRTNPNLTAVPTFEIDLAWHTHMLFPENYREFTIGYLSKFLNHDDTIPETQLQDYVQQTENAWKHRIEPKQEPVRDVENTASAKTDKGFRNKLRSIFIKEKEVKVIVDPERLFQGAYHVGTFQASPAYDETGDSKTVDKDIDKYDVNNASFHDRREIKAFINLKNSQAVMDIKFDRVKKSELGFIGTSTCGTTDYLNRWEIKNETSKGNFESKSYTQVFVSNGPMPLVIKDKLLELPVDQRMQHIGPHTSTPSENLINTTEFESFNWYKISFIWANSFKNKDYAANVLSIPTGGIGSSCGGSAIANCAGSSGVKRSDGAMAIVSMTT